jgi:phosphoribosylanthranilate isomerase
VTRVKICGVTQKAHAVAAVEAGANFIGLVFAPSKRQVTLAQAQEIANAIKEHQKPPEVVGVFVNMTTLEVNRIAHLCNLDWVQLSGDESWEYCGEISQSIIKTVHIGPGRHTEETSDYLASGSGALADRKYLYLLDSQVKGKYGGTGITSDWNLAREVAKRFPVILAGGLTPENVTEAIKIVAPWGVDVSSGVEVSGVKDITKIKAFIEAVRRADDG